MRSKSLSPADGYEMGDCKRASRALLTPFQKGQVIFSSLARVAQVGVMMGRNPSFLQRLSLMTSIVSAGTDIYAQLKSAPDPEGAIAKVCSSTVRVPKWLITVGNIVPESKTSLGQCAYKGTCEGVTLYWIDYANSSEDAAFHELQVSQAEFNALLDICHHRFVKQIGNCIQIEEAQIGPLCLEGESHFIATSQYQDLKRELDLFLSHGKCFSRVLKGPPGVGKTETALTLARSIPNARIALLNLHIASSFSPVSNISWHNVLRVYRPNVVIIDDLDKLTPKGQVELLDAIAEVNKSATTRLLIATANSEECIEAGLLREGRFGLVTPVELTEEDYKKLVPPELIDQFQGWSIAEICKWKELDTILGREAALQRIPTMRQHAIQVQTLEHRQSTRRFDRFGS